MISIRIKNLIVIVFLFYSKISRNRMFHETSQEKSGIIRSSLRHNYFDLFTLLKISK